MNVPNGFGSSRYNCSSYKNRKTFLRSLGARLFLLLKLVQVRCLKIDKQAGPVAKPLQDVNNGETVTQKTTSKQGFGSTLCTACVEIDDRLLAVLDALCSRHSSTPHQGFDVDGTLFCGIVGAQPYRYLPIYVSNFPTKPIGCTGGGIAKKGYSEKTSGVIKLKSSPVPQCASFWQPKAGTYPLLSFPGDKYPFQPVVRTLSWRAVSESALRDIATPNEVTPQTKPRCSPQARKKLAQ